MIERGRWRSARFVTEGEKVTTWFSKVNWDCVLSCSIVARDKAEGTRFCKSNGWDHSRIILGVNKLFWALRWMYLYWCLGRSLSCLMIVMHAGVGELLRFSSCEVENFCIWTPMELLLAMHSTGEPARRLITTQLAWKGSRPRHWGKTALARPLKHLPAVPKSNHGGEMTAKQLVLRTMPANQLDISGPQHQRQNRDLTAQMLAHRRRKKDQQSATVEGDW